MFSLCHGQGAKDHQAAENTANKEGLGSRDSKRSSKPNHVALLPEHSPKVLKPLALNPRGHAASTAAHLIAAARVDPGEGHSKQRSGRQKASYGDEDAEDDEDELSTGDSSRNAISSRHVDCARGTKI